MPKDITSVITKILSGDKPVERAKENIDASNKKVQNLDDPTQMHKHYDISSDMDSEKDLPEPGVKLDRDNDEDDLEYVKHKMGLDKPEESHEVDDAEDEAEKSPVDLSKKVSFSEYAKNDAIRRRHLRRMKIKQYTKI